MRLRSISVLLLGLAFASASTAMAQVTTTGSIQLVIEDPQGGRLPGVTVTASAPDVVTTRQAVSNAEGVATLEALAPSASYVVKAALAGFRDLERPAILVRSGQVTTLRLQLVLSTMTESVTVTGLTTPVVDVTRAVSGTGHHAAADRVAPNRPQLPELPSAGAGRHAGQPGVARATRHRVRG